jgi:hypothetical protein
MIQLKRGRGVSIPSGSTKASQRNLTTLMGILSGVFLAQHSPPKIRAAVSVYLAVEFMFPSYPAITHKFGVINRRNFSSRSPFSKKRREEGRREVLR